MKQINYTDTYDEISSGMVTLNYKEEDALTPEFKKRWVEALRSGEYSQGDSYLMSPIANGEDLYCCLGVACDIRGIKLGYNEQFPQEDYDVPAILKEKHDIAMFLAEKNDDNDWSFNRIADWIEEYL